MELGRGCGSLWSDSGRGSEQSVNDPFSVRSQKSAAQRLLTHRPVVVGSVPQAPLPFARPLTSI